MPERNGRGSWFRMATSYYDDPRVLAVTNDAEATYVRSLAFAKAQGTDGMLPDVSLPVIGRKDEDPADVARQLVAVGLWTPARGGWRIPLDKWLKWQDPHGAGLGAPQDAGTMQRRAAAHAKHHRDGRHSQVPRTDCPLCEKAVDKQSDEDF